MKMKELRLMFKSLVLLAFGLGASQQVKASGFFSQTYYHRLTVNTTGGGTVYLSENEQTLNENGVVEGVTYMNNYQNQNYSSNSFILFPYSDMTVYVFAKANSGYVFSHWSTNSTGCTINNPNNLGTSATLTSTSTNSNRPTNYTITANYVLDNGMVKVATANANWGAVRIDNINNVAGQNVTITAVPMISLQGVKFLYWTKTEEGGTEEIVQNSTAEMTVIATTTKTTYTAYFSAPVETKGVFCRIKNIGSGNYLSMVGDQPAVQITEGSGDNQELYYIVNSMSSIAPTSAVSDPSTIFFLSGENDGQQGFAHTNIEAQGVSMIEKITNGLSDITLEYTPNGYRLYIIYNEEGRTVRLYLRNDNTGVRFKGDNDNNALWDIEIVDEDSMDDYYFGMAPKSYFTKMHNGEQKYYTTLYTSFSYKLMDGVNAYYIDKDNVEEHLINGRVYLNEIPSGSVIPGMRGVILECSTPEDAKKNRLIPVSKDVDPDIYSWPLLGYIKLNGNAVYPSDYEDSGHEFYVLSVNSNHEKLGFYQYSKELSSNKAFAVVPSEYVNYAKTARVIWYGDDTDNVNNIELVFPEKEQYYDLQGRKVENPQKGIYIINGRKVIK